MNVRFKIQSCSSHAATYPPSNLLSRHTPWQSQRFCDYPQQLTISFYQPILLKSIKIVAHPFKTPTRINILYHLASINDEGYLKYGFIAFDEPKEGVFKSESKQIEDVNVKATQLRFILVKPYHNKGNFFGQVGLAALEIKGEPIEHLVPGELGNSMVRSRKGSFQGQSSLLMQLKESFVRKEQFEEAKQVKQMENVLERAKQQVAELEKEKQRCVQIQDFMGAKRIRDQLNSLRQRFSDLASKFYDPQSQIRMIKSDVALRQKIQEMNLTKKSTSFNQSRFNQSRNLSNEDGGLLKDVGEVTSQDDQNEGREEEELKESRITHDERILPAVLNKMKGISAQPIVEPSQMGDNQFFDSGEKSSLPPQPQPLGPRDEANSSLLLDFYQPMFIRKLYSRFWQFRLQAISQSLQQLKSSQSSTTYLTKARLRAYLFIYTISLKTNSYKTTATVLELMDLLAQSKISAEESLGHVHRDLHNQLENAVKVTLKLLGESNMKIRNHAQKTILRIMGSPVFGVHASYSGLVKSYPEKGVGRLRRVRLENLSYLVEKYGIGQTTVPHSITGFAIKATNDLDAEVRKAAVELIKAVKNKGGKNKIDSLLGESRVKASVVRQLEH